MEPLNQNEWIISFKIVNRAIVEALFQIYQNTHNENPQQRGLHSSEEMPYEVSHHEFTNFQLQTETNQENTSLNLYQTESDGGTSCKMAPENYFYDDDQACAPDLNHPRYVCEVNTINGVQSDVPDMEQPNFSNIPKSKSNPVHIPNRNVDENSCKMCNKYFKYNSQLNRHILNYSEEKPFKRNTCPKRFTQKFDLNRHMLIHSGTKAFICNVCEQLFTQKWNFNRHMSTHSEEKPFQCDICNKQFAREAYVKIHMLIHFGKKPHNCPICNRGFTQKSSLNKHILTHEKKIY